MAVSIKDRCCSILSISKYDKMLYECLGDIRSSRSYTSKIAVMADAYMIAKKVSNDLYGVVGFEPVYEMLKDTIVCCERELSSTFITDSNPVFKFDDERFLDKDIFNLEDEDLLDYIVWFTRTRVFEKNRDCLGKDVDINSLSLVNDCSLASNIIKMVCSKMKINCRIVKIPPAYTDDIMLYRGNGFHYFCLIDLFDKQYLVDCTYRQFFKLDNNIMERLGVVGLNGCAPGVYMMQNDSRKNTAIKLLKRGWVEATETNLKNYLDGFTLSFRNGLYYEWLGKIDYDISYSCDDYFYFLNSLDNQINHEPLECLGEQKKPLEEYKLKFKL